MPLSPGARIGAFEIESTLGAGGMGEVYRARDTRLDRVVAIKALPEAFARDPERLARFEREARVLASLAHPHIAGIHGLEDVAGTPHLVLEFVDGETLERRLARGPLAVRETLEVCAQVAAAIEAAHEGGVVHRDLKPGNIMLSPTQGAKVLDFGLARGSVAASSSLDLSATPTIGLSATADGLVLGTAPYMSPEQARGQAVDRRTDVWAFGCVLYECLTGRRAFGGETVSDVVARILERDPDWEALPAAVPARVRQVVKRCLVKDARERPRDIGDLGRELAAIVQELSTPGGARRAADARPSLAVLYFENLAKDPESEYFCAGITEDIVTDLSKIKGLRVASRNAVQRYRGAPADIPRVAAELGVAAVLEGSVRRAGDRVRISAQLISAGDGFHLWADRYDRTLQDVFAVQEEIASSIAKALQVALTPAESRSLVQDRPRDARAYDLYLKGREQYGRYTDASLRAALALFRQATEVDPGYALAWAGIADSHAQRVSWGFAEDNEASLRDGRAAAERAIELDPRLPEAYKAHALVLRNAGDHAGAKAVLEKVLEIDPRFVPALSNLAVQAVEDADLAGSERLFRRALDCDGQYPFGFGWLGFLLALTGRGEEAVAWADRLRALTDETFYVTSAHAMRVGVQLMRGDLAAAEAALGAARADGADASNLAAFEVLAAVKGGRAESVRARVGELEAAPGLLGGSMMALATAMLRMGEVDRAARYFGKHRLVGGLAEVLARLDPELHGVLDHPPFAPRRSSQALVWPLEAPMMDPRVHAVFREVRIESGRPQGSAVSGSRG